MSSRLGIAGIVLLAAFGLAACGGGGGGTATAPEQTEPAPNPEEERSAIQTAINAAGQALAVVTAAGEDATEAQIAAAETAVAQARAAIAAADDLPATEIAQHNTALGLIDMPLMAARDELDARVESAALMAAQDAASAAAMAARTAANDARTRANEVAELAGGDSYLLQLATEAGAAADAAEAAADAAETANERAQAATTSADAEAAQADAVSEQREAETQLASAMRVSDQAMGISDSQMIAAAREAALTAKNEAMDHYTAAMGKARDARTKATEARTAANRALAARTDYMAADMAADAAEAAADAAEAARDRASAAKDAAAAAYMAALSATTAEAAKAEQAKAEDQNAIAVEAHTGATGAGMAYMTARDEAMKAQEAVGRHVIGLLIAANGQDITEPELDTDMDTVVMTVEQLREAATGRAVTALNTAAGEDDNGEDSTTATVTWPGDVPANPDATPPTEAVPGMLSVVVTTEGANALTFRTVAAEDDPATTDVDESMTMPKTAGNIAGLGGFNGFSISDGERYAIVFTDKTQDDAPVAASPAVTFRYVEDEAVTDGTQLTLGDDKTGPTYTGVTWNPGGGEAPLTGTLSCAATDTANCDIQINAEGAITAIAGYGFTGSRAARAEVQAMDAAAQAAANQDYLVFGVWMDEDGDANGTADDPQIGAFAAGGSMVDNTTYGGAAVTGEAQYNGSATGVYTEGSSVDYFQGDATLTAKFGDATALGTITGRIHNIVSGEGSHADIHLGLDDQDVQTPVTNNIGTDGTFSGRAWMGDGVLGEDGEPDYPMNGSWSGQFYNGTADDTATTDVNESHVAPDAVAGTFGVTGSTGTGDDAVTRSYVGSFGANKQ